jgi:membrane protein insertase Oxa1/YidC/SpoIIIJ
MRGPLNGVNLLPILLAVVFFLQQRMQQKTMPKPTDETQANTQMISQYMILLFPFFLYLAPSGLNLYIFASTTGGIVDTWFVRRHLRATGILPPVGAAAK